MSLVPEFEIGLWNAWIFTIWGLLTIPLFIRAAKKRGAFAQEEEVVSVSAAQKLGWASSKIALFAGLVYAFFLPLKLGTVWFYVGLPITLVAVAGDLLVTLHWVKAPPEELLTRGPYRYSRHPMYVFMFLLFSGISLVSVSWLFFVFLVLSTIGCIISAGLEEKGLIEQYGDAYREYMKTTPRWIGIPKKGTE